MVNEKKALQISSRFLKIANESASMKPMLKKFVKEINKVTQCEAVGIRILHDDLSIPYESYMGFPDTFYQNESPLKLDKDECMCIHVIKGDIDPSRSFYTKFGSFYMNGTTRFLSGLTAEEKSHTRIICNEYGYESVALVPVKLKKKIIGLIHIADPKENMCPFETIQLLELVALHLGSTYSRLKAEEMFRKNKEDLNQIIQERTEELTVSNLQLKQEIEDRIFVQKQLLEQQKRMQAFFDATFDSIALVECDGTVVAANQTVVNNFNCSLDEFIGKNVFQYLPENTSKLRKKKFDEVEKTKKSIQFIDERGDLVFENNIHPIFDEKGHVVLLAIYARNITKQYHTEKDLKVSESKYRLLANHITDMISTHDFEGNYTFVSPSSQSLLGYNPEELLGRNAYEFFYHEDIERIRQSHESIMINNTPSTVTYRLVKKNGNAVWVETISRVIPSDSAKTHGTIICSTRNVNDRKMAEFALTESEERFRILFDQAPLSYQSLDEKGCFLDVNQTFLDMLGYQRYKIIGKWFGDFLSESSLGDFKQHFQEFLKKGCISDVTFELKKKDGSFIFMQLNGRIGVDAQGKFKQTHCILNDVTETIKMQKELTLSEEKYRMLFNNAPLGIFRSTLEGKFLEVNQALAKMLGFDSAEHVIKQIDNIAEQIYVKPDDRVPIVEKTKNDSDVQHFVNIYKKRDGEHFTANLYIKRIEDPIHGLIFEGMVEDITERKKVEEELIRSRSILAEAERMANLGSWFWDVEKNVFEFSAEWQQIHGCKNSQLSYESLLPLTHPDDVPIIEKAFKESLRQNKSYEVEHRIIRKDTGELRYVKTYGELNYNDVGKPVFMYGATQDITDQKKIDHVLQESKEQYRNLVSRLQEVREEERMVIAREIHDELGQLLTALKMDAFWLNNHIRDQYQDKVNSMLSLLDQCIKSVKRIASSLRPGVLDDLGLIPALQWQSREFEMFSDIKCLFKTELESIELDPDMATTLFRIYQESLTNVARHAQASQVLTSLYVKDSEIHLMIRDNGKGISLKKVQDSGSLGLLGMRERVVPFNGVVNIDGKPGKGTLIHVKIPISLHTEEASCV